MASVTPLKRPRQPLDLPLCVTAGSTIAGLSFLSGWLLVVAHWPWAPRGFVDFFAPGQIDTIEAMLTGGVIAVIAGAVFGAAFGLTYNLIGRMRRAKAV